MLSALVNKFSCPDCSLQTELNIPAPLFITCSACGNTYFVDKDKTATKNKLQKRNLQPIKTITLGASGNYKNESFKIIGHIRSIGNNAISNEWLMQFSNGKQSWLIENGFSYFIFETEPIVVKQDIIKSKKTGHKITVDKIEYTIVDLSKQIEFQMEGQLPENCYNDDNYFKYECIDAQTGNLLSVCIFDKQTIEGFKGVSIDLSDLKLSTITEFNNWI